MTEMSKWIITAKYLRKAVNEADGNWAKVNIDILLDIAEWLESGSEPTFTSEEIEMIEAPWSLLQSQQELEGGQ